MSRTPQKSDRAAAAKAKQQKTILIAGCVVLLAMAALQGPKLLKHGGATAADPVASSQSGTTLTPVSTTSPGTSVATTAAAGATAGSVAGVALPAGATVAVATDQLASFRLFEVKDPFVPQAGNETVGDTGAIPSADEPLPVAGPPPADKPTGQGAKPVTAAAPHPAALNSATIKIDGKEQQVTLKATFPTDDPAFVLVSLTKKAAKIAVSGGSFDTGETVKLEVGKKLVLVNTATDVRYEVLLVRTENAAAFTAQAPAAATAAAPAAPTPTPQP
ncbi:MAG: hypothetical protein EXQ81_00690 [Thermoleophilia bacterium]|nr:hypothetical protein [Thermoleophilia bacterium]